MNKIKLTVMICLLLFGLQIILPMQSPVQAKQNTKHLVNNTYWTNVGTDKNAFLTTWNTSAVSSGSSNANQIKLPLTSDGTFNFIVKWGDGSQNTITSYNQAEVTHTYTNPGIYNVNITGFLDGWNFFGYSDVLKLLEISQWGYIQLGSVGSYFNGAKNLRLTAIDAPNLTSTTHLDYAFTDCTNLGDSGSMNNWNTSQVTSMREMFYRATSFNQPISNWDVSHVTDMIDMFFLATSFNQPIGNWNVSAVTNMNFMFSNAFAFDQPLNNWDVSQVTQMGFLFYNTQNFNQPIGNWNVSNVIDMIDMFYGAKAFNQPLDTWNTANVTTMNNMFAWTKNFNQPLGNWNVSAVTDFSQMFYQTNLSISNYDNLLMGWSKLDLQHNVIFDGGFSYYGSEAVSARQYIITTFNWTISDWGLAIGPTAPLSLTITSGYGNLSLSWSAPTSVGNYNHTNSKIYNYNITNYKIYRSEQNDSGFKLIGTTSKLTFTDTGVKTGVKYYYIVEATNNFISGANSTVISGTPLVTSTISQGKSSPLSLFGVILGVVIITGIRVTKHRKRSK